MSIVLGQTPTGVEIQVASGVTLLGQLFTDPAGLDAAGAVPFDAARAKIVYANATDVSGKSGLIDPYDLFTTSRGQRIILHRIYGTVGAAIVLTATLTDGRGTGTALTTVDDPTYDVVLGTFTASGIIELADVNFVLLPGQKIRVSTGANTVGAAQITLVFAAAPLF